MPLTQLRFVRIEFSKMIRSQLLLNAAGAESLADVLEEPYDLQYICEMAMYVFHKLITTKHQFI